MKLDELEIAYTIDVLERLVQSADGYIEDGNWLEPLTDDIKNAKQLIKMAAIAQRAATINASSGTELINMDEINALLEEQKSVQEQGQKLLEQAPVVQLEAAK